MIFKDDISYIQSSMPLVERGLLRVAPYQIRIDRYFTEEEMAENRRIAATYDRPDGSRDNAGWSAHCEETRQRIAAEVESLMTYLENHFTFGQYKVPYPDDYDFWFWCNDLYNTTNKQQSGRDMSYITLSLDKENDVDKNEAIFNKVKRLIENYPAKNIQAHFQYTTVKNNAAIEAEAERIFSLCDGKFINYGRVVGKLGKKDGRYIFKKKNAKKYFYYIDAMDICANVVA